MGRTSAGAAFDGEELALIVEFCMLITSRIKKGKTCTCMQTQIIYRTERKARGKSGKILD
jgi:hypothetical protein